MATGPLSRAEFLKLLALAGVGAAVLGRTPERALAALTAADQALDAAALDGDAAASRAAGATVLAVAHGSSPAANVKRAVAAVGGMKKYVRAGDVVVVKPNIGFARAPKFAATTDPAVIATLVTLARRAGAKQVLVMDNPVGADPGACYDVSGIGKAARAAGASVQVMGASGYARYTLPGHLLKTQPLYRAVVEADVLINVPVAKQHDSTGLTLAGKNLMGVTSDRGRMHTLGLSQGIAELNAKLRPQLTVIDATRILVANGPSGGRLSDVRTKDTVIACSDWVAADTYAARLFGKKPAAVPYIKAAAAMHLGTMDLAAVRVRIV
jgi:uncharacterized protein (DUF362 family)